MSKRLEEEYRQMVNDQVPDLWNRIEAGLREKNTPPVGQPVQQQVYQQPVQQAVQPNKPKKPVIFKILPWAGGVAAAAILFILVIPAVLSMTRKSNTATMSFKDAGNSIQPAAAEMANYESVEMAENAEAVPEDAAAGGSFYGADDLENIDGSIRQDEVQQGTSLGPKALSGETKREHLAGEDAEKILYARVMSILEDQNSGTTYITLFVGTVLEEVTKVSDTDSKNAVLDILSENSPLQPKEGKTYRIESDDYGVLLLEEAK